MCKTPIKMKRLGTIVLVAIVTMITAAYTWNNLAHGASVPRNGMHDIKVICARISDRISTRMTCQEWVDQLNNEVAPWYNTVTDGEVNLQFSLPDIHTGQQMPTDGWFVSGYTSTGGIFASTFQQDVIDYVDAWIDFSSTDRFFVVVNGTIAWGQSGSSCSLDDNFLCSGTYSVAEGGEENINGSLRRRMASLLLFENDVQNPASHMGMDYTSMFAIHEMGHMLGFADRYIPAFGGRDFATGYSPMGVTYLRYGRAHFLVHEQNRQGWLGSSAGIEIVPKQSPAITNSYDVVSPAYRGNFTDRISAIYVPTQSNMFTLQDFVGYTIEARKHQFGNDDVIEEGIVITLVDESSQEGRDLLVVEDPNMTTTGNWQLAFEVGDIHTDAARGVTIEVVSALNDGSGYSVRVTNTDPTDMKPDLAIRPWDRNWNSPDIWVDSPTNGIGTFEPGGSDRPAVKANSGDPDLVDQIHFRVNNQGASTSIGAYVAISFTFSGAGQLNWTQIATWPLGVVNPGAEASGAVNWVVPFGTLPDAHGCIKVEILGGVNELSLNNNLAQENIFAFQTWQSSPWQARQRTVTISNPSRKQNAVVLMDVRYLPQDWKVIMKPESFKLPPEGSQEVVVKLDPGDDKSHKPGYKKNVSFVPVMFYEDGHSVTDNLGFSFNVHFTKRTKLDLEVQDVGKTSVKLGGCLSSRGRGIGGQKVMLQIATPKHPQKWLEAKTDKDGCYTIDFKSKLTDVEYTAVAHYTTDGIFADAVSAGALFVLK